MGDVSEVLSFGNQPGSNQYAILKVVREQAKINKPLKEVREEVKSYVALQNSQADPAFIRKLSKRLRDADIKLNVEQFKSLVYSFKNTPELPPMISKPSSSR
ncbi:MAG: hypothetical protein ACUVT8_07860 [Armatimonadota bacterium]